MQLIETLAHFRPTRVTAWTPKSGVVAASVKFSSPPTAAEVAAANDLLKSAGAGGKFVAHQPSDSLVVTNRGADGNGVEIETTPVIDFATLTDGLPPEATTALIHDFVAGNEMHPFLRAGEQDERRLMDEDAVRAARALDAGDAKFVLTSTSIPDFPEVRLEVPKQP